MKLKPYPSYKDSGVEWLDDIPTGWSVKPLKVISDLRLSNVDKHTVDDEPAVLLCNYVDVYKNERIGSNIEFMSATASEEQIKRLSLMVGDVIITKDSEDPRDIGIPAYIAEIRTNLVCGYHLALIRPSKNTSGEFLYYFLKSRYAAASFENEACGITRYAIGKYSIGNLDISIPLLADQINIATFLDRETGKLDTLISKQEHLIELLQEKRQAIISHAVTKGLNPDAKMKDSGVAWLGDVPAEWNVKPLKIIADLRLSNIDKHTVEGQPPVLLCNYVDVYKNERISKDIKFMSATASEEQIKRLSLVVGDVIITKDSEDPRDIGIPTYVAEILPDLVCGYHLALIRSNNETSGEFLYYFLKSRYVAASFENEACGITRYAIGKYSIGNLDISTPSLAEQISIANYLDLQTAKIDTLIEKAKSSIDLAKEHRTALISAAVTGKIDVRDYVNDLETV